MKPRGTLFEMKKKKKVNEQKILYYFKFVVHHTCAPFLNDKREKREKEILAGNVPYQKCFCFSSPQLCSQQADEESIAADKYDLSTHAAIPSL